jgi:hypothetical protein
MMHEVNTRKNMAYQARRIGNGELVMAGCLITGGYGRWWAWFPHSEMAPKFEGRHGVRCDDGGRKGWRRGAQAKAV